MADQIKNHRFTKLIIILIAFCASLTINAQKADKLVPRWLHSTLEPSNTTFIYDVISSDASSLSDARDQALSSLIVQAGLEGGQTVKSDVESSSEERHLVQHGQRSNFADYMIKVKSTLEGKPATLTAKKIDEYWVRNADGSYHLSTLYARSLVNETPRFDDVKLTTNYGVHGLWRSAIVPGWGQLYKGSTVKGGCIMGATALCIGGIVYTDCMRNSYTSKINKTHSATQKKSYADKRTAFTTGRNICIGALCAVYVYNIVDAIVAPGARRILTSPAGANKFSYFWSPAVTEDNGLGVVASITF